MAGNFCYDFVCKINRNSSVTGCYHFSLLCCHINPCIFQTFSYDVCRLLTAPSRRQYKIHLIVSTHYDLGCSRSNVDSYIVHTLSSSSILSIHIESLPVSDHVEVPSLRQPFGLSPLKSLSPFPAHKIHVRHGSVFPR